MLVDSHCHLDFDDFADDREAVLRRAQQAGIRTLVTIGIRVREFARVRAAAAMSDIVWCTVGTHPHHADEERDVTAAELCRLACDPKVVGIGECGLDRLLGSASWQAQLESFQVHVDAARRTQLPLVIHCVREDEAMAAILLREHAAGSFPVVMHCFSGGDALAATCISLGHFISFSGLLTYPEHDALRALARSIPDDRILVETDAPSLPPAALQGMRNEPAHLHHVVRLLAELRGVGTEMIARQTTENFHRAFPRCSRT